ALFVREGLREKRLARTLALPGVFGLLYALILFDSNWRNVGDAFISEKVRQLTLNPDTLYHASVAAMFKGYHHIGTGLHGFRHMSYHVLSHMLYGWTSRLLTIDVTEVYGFANFIAFGALLVTGMLRVVAELPVKLERKFAVANLLLIGGPLSQAFGWFTDSYFVSESYLIGLLTLSGAMALMVRLASARKVSRGDLALLLAYLPVVSLGKISVGVILTVSALLLLAVHAGMALRERAAALGATLVAGGLGYLLAKQKPVPGLEAKFHWKHYQNAAADPSLLHFVFTQFVFVFLLVPALVIVWPRLKTERERLTWLLVVFAGAAIGFLALNLTLDSSGYYFANVHTFMALPCLALFLAANPDPLRQAFDSRRARAVYPALLVYLLLAATVSYFTWVFPAHLEVGAASPPCSDCRRRVPDATCSSGATRRIPTRTISLRLIKTIPMKSSVARSRGTGFTVITA
ncbi:MAG: hypothetical protein HY075_01755, partial [Deltaproteobacteria bacterium]|nr:hypothetical protein [Deltaproteobacteria bacterium]